MLITDVAMEMLPLWLIETQDKDGKWNVFTLEPFATKEKAESHRLLILENYGSESTVRVNSYTKEHLQDDLVEAVLDEPYIAKKALSTIDPIILQKLLREEYAD